MVTFSIMDNDPEYNQWEAQQNGPPSNDDVVDRWVAVPINAAVTKANALQFGITEAAYIQLIKDQM